MQEFIPVEVGAVGWILVRDKSKNHRTTMAVVDKVTHQASHRDKLHVRMLADALEKLVHNLAAQLVIDRDESVLGELQTNHTTQLPRTIVGGHKDSTLALHGLHRRLGFVETHTATQNLVAHSRLAYGVDNLLGEIPVATTADSATLLLALVGERVAQVAHYHLAAISEHISQKQIDKAANDVVSYEVG